MGNLYARIETMCHNKGVSITDMCRESGASRGSLSDLKMGRISSLTAGTLSKLSAYFGVSIDVLIGNDELQPTKTAGEEEQQKSPPTKKVSGLVAAGYDDLTPENRAVIDSLIEKLLKSQSGD